MTDFLILTNGMAVDLSRLPELDENAFHQHIVSAVLDKKLRPTALIGLPEPTGNLRLLAVLGQPFTGRLFLCSTVVGKSFESLTPEVSGFHYFEREIHEEFGVDVRHHPWLKPVRFQQPGDNPELPAPVPGVTDYFTLKGRAVHEVAVGPVHAGVIEPGHFRFQCLGEVVKHLEIELGYQHRGVEKMLLQGPDKRTLPLIETAAGDSSVAASCGYANLISALDPEVVTSREAQVVQAIALELERIANHVGDLGALAGDIAYLPTSSYCGRIRGEYLNLTADFCGNRFGRNLVVPGGWSRSFTPKQQEHLVARLAELRPQLDNALNLMFDAPSVLDRLERTGTVNPDDAAAIGLVGVAARGCGISGDVRKHYPWGAYRRFAIDQATEKAGDILARSQVRRREIAASHDVINRMLSSLKNNLVPTAPPHHCHLAPHQLAISLVEAWRGELLYLAVTDDQGQFRRFKIVDPSFHNWFGLALALRDEAISDFPICNKSFNLSYCGHDL